MNISTTTIHIYLVVTFIPLIVMSSRNYIVYAPKYAIKAHEKDDVIIKKNQPLLRVAGFMTNRGNKKIKDLSFQTTLRTDNTSTTRRLAYKDDLVGALNELQKKLNAKKTLTENKTCQEKPTHQDYLPAAIITTKPNRILKRPNNLKDIIELIQSGINVNHQQPANENFEWIKIRIPRQKI